MPMAKNEALDSKYEIAWRRRLRRNNRSHPVVRQHRKAHREHPLHDGRNRDTPHRRRNHCNRNSGRSRATRVSRRPARHAHLQAAAMRRWLRGKHARPNRKQQHAHKGNRNCRPLVESEQHSHSLPRTHNRAVTHITPVPEALHQPPAESRRAAQHQTGLPRVPHSTSSRIPQSPKRPSQSPYPAPMPPS
jgi:hypothetical protein